MKRLFGRPELVDSLVLISVVVVSALPWIGRLGFYSDDWSYLAALQQTASSGFGSMIRGLVHADPGLLVRPVQLVCLVLEFRAFGLRPLPYHLAIVGLLSAMVVLLYLALRAIPLARRSSVAIAALFAFLPQYSTDRFWISSQQSLLCMIFAFAGIYGLLRYASPIAGGNAWRLGLASACFVASTLSYEVALGLIAASIIIVAWRSSSRFRNQRQGSGPLPILATAIPTIVLGLVKVHYQHRYVLHHRIPLFWIRPEVWRLAAENALRFNFGTYGLRLPLVLTSLYRHAAITAAAAAVSIAIAVVLVIYFVRVGDTAPSPSRRSALAHIGAGLIVFTLGYALFSPLPGTAFESAGPNNRITIASAVGASCVVVGVMQLFATLMASARLRSHAFGCILALVCGLYALVSSGISHFWVDASSKQAAIVGTMRDTLGSLPHQSVTLLDGFCQYSGPAVVFETDWDTTGALQLLFGDPTLTGDVISKEMQFNEDSVDSFIYGDHEGHYTYGKSLFVYNTQSKILINLPSRTAAQHYLDEFKSARDNRCASAQAGDGVPIF
jgi:hypothetical protein